MESIAMGDQEDQPTNSSEEEQDVGVVGGRSYECMFCRRGFTTAQALGGHMNIHRKDRAKSRPINDSSKQDDHSCYARPRFYQPVFASYPPSVAPNHQERQVGYRTYFSSTSGARPMNYENNHQDPREAITSTSRDERTMSLSLQFGGSRGEDKDPKRRIQCGDQEDELDLELRLGHDP